MRVLVVEDEVHLADAIARGMRRAGLAVDIAHDGERALGKARLVGYDVVLLDRDLPVLHGDEVCRALVAECPGTRILMLTAAGEPRRVIDGLDLGADDYVAKPFQFEVLLARVRALARRSGNGRPPVLRHGDLELDPADRTVRRDGVAIELTRKEFGVLHELLAAAGAVLSAEQLLERVWDENVDPFTNTVRVTVMTLRRKLGPPALVQTVVGTGYAIR
ncbi:MAG TPA: response regulator transcription factor [Solirubrobacteraceae bacterium]|jgi:DNA-binding response OmpR family regulator|nr:response regulator transcription factor [Solirubrobacteraceae bacterium]